MRFKTTFSLEYLQGIKDGRATLKLEGAARAKELAESELRFCDRVSTCMGSANHQDYIKGLRDFWKHQLAKDTTTPA